MEGEEEGETLELEMGLRGEREIDGSEINPCFIIVDTSLEDAIEERKWVIFGREDPMEKKKKKK